MMEEVNSTMTYCKSFCKCTPSTTITKNGFHFLKKIPLNNKKLAQASHSPWEPSYLENHGGWPPWALISTHLFYFCSVSPLPIMHTINHPKGNPSSGLDLGGTWAHGQTPPLQHSLDLTQHRSQPSLQLKNLSFAESSWSTFATQACYWGPKSQEHSEWIFSLGFHHLFLEHLSHFLKILEVLTNTWH
jgi:hypothetical protein